MTPEEFETAVQPVLDQVTEEYLRPALLAAGLDPEKYKLAFVEPCCAGHRPPGPGWCINAETDGCEPCCDRCPDDRRTNGEAGPGDTWMIVAEGPQAAKEEHWCSRCGSTEWVSVSLDEGHTRRAQCVPCGWVHAALGPGWRAGRYEP